MKHKLFLFAVIFILNVVSFFAQALKLPYKDVGTCPFECCTYQQWTANKDTILLKNPNDSSPVLFKVKKGENVEGVTGIVFTTKAGIGKALQNTNLEHYNEKNNVMSNVGIKKGSAFSLLTYQGEDVYKVWFNGRILYAKFGSDSLKAISRPKSIWWVKIKNIKGQIGWTKMTKNFENVDACG